MGPTLLGDGKRFASAQNWNPIYPEDVHIKRNNNYDGMGNPVTLRHPGGPDSSMVEHLVQFQKGLGLSPGPVTFHAAINHSTGAFELLILKLLNI